MPPDCRILSLWSRRRDCRHQRRVVHVGGIRDLRQLFRDLKKRQIDNNDNGQVLEKDEIVR